MKYFLKKTLLFLILVFFFLFAGCDLLDYLFGEIEITDPTDGTVVGTSSVTIYVESTFNYIDYISVYVNDTEVYFTSESNFSYTVSLEPGLNTIEVICYAYQSEEDTMSSFAGSDSIDVYYDDEDPEISIDSPANWSIVQIISGDDVTVSGTVSDNYGIASLEYLDDGVYHAITFDVYGDWSLDLPNLSENTHSYAFKVEDFAERAVMSFITFTVEYIPE